MERPWRLAANGAARPRDLRTAAVDALSSGGDEPRANTLLRSPQQGSLVVKESEV